MLTSIFESFLEKLSKEKEYILIENLIQIEYLNQIFKVFKEAFDEDIHI